MKENRVTVLNGYPTDYLIHVKGNLYTGKIEDSQAKQVIKFSIKTAKLASSVIQYEHTVSHRIATGTLCQACRLVLKGTEEGPR